MQQNCSSTRYSAVDDNCLNHFLNLVCSSGSGAQGDSSLDMPCHLTLPASFRNSDLFAHSNIDSCRRFPEDNEEFFDNDASEASSYDDFPSVQLTWEQHSNFPRADAVTTTTDSEPRARKQVFLPDEHLLLDAQCSKKFTSWFSLSNKASSSGASSCISVSRGTAV